MEVDHSRAARAGAEDKAAADQRIATRRRRRRGLVVVILLALLVAEFGVIGYRRWFGPQSLAVGTRATVTMRRMTGTDSCGPNPATWSSASYGGVWWEPLATFPASWGTTGPWKGELAITAPVKRHVRYQMGPGPEVANGNFTYHGVTIPMAGPGYLSTGPIC